MRYVCCDDRRLAAVQRAGVLNGIEYLEVSDSEAPTPGLRQRTLYVRLLKQGAALTPDDIVIAGGDRIPDVGVEWIAPATALPPLPPGEAAALVAGLRAPDTVWLIRTDSSGDHSTYTLRLTASGSGAPPAGFDPLLSAVRFSFKVECEADFDCRPGHRCPVHAEPGPSIDYLAKDYGSFRRVMLDRLSLLAPGWTERSPADLGVALVEVLAYVADELSYRQDAVATEAYLDTARLRTSLRRHARLVDHHVHDGANSRVWAVMVPDSDGVVVPAGTPLLTRVEGVAERVEPDGPEHRAALLAGAETFETMEPAVVSASTAVFDFWTWGDVGCCLPVGATAATLRGTHPGLKAGDVLILREVVGARTGHPEDADPAHVHAVRLTHVADAVDPSGGLFDETPSNDPVAVTEIAWDGRDGLPSPLCVSAENLPGVAVARAYGNVVLADHGRTVSDEDLGAVVTPSVSLVASDGSHCEPVAPRLLPSRWRPTLRAAPLTQRAPSTIEVLAESTSSPALEAELGALAFGPALEQWLGGRGVRFRSGAPVVRGGHGVWSISDGVTIVALGLDGERLTVRGRQPAASASLVGPPRTAVPVVSLNGTTPAGVVAEWAPRRDLLAASGDSREFVVEVEHDGSATLRFGDGLHGRRPDPGTVFTATYRIGNGTAGNIGSLALGHVVSTSSALTGVTNLLPAEGGVDPESAAEIRRDAPEAYLVQQRAVTAEDYAGTAQAAPGVQRAAATFRWTGSWHTVFVTADRSGGVALDEDFESELRDHLEPFRMAGYDLEVDVPHFVALELDLFVCVSPGHFRSRVATAIRDRLTSGVRADGTLGVFHPDRFSFGQPVFLSAVLAEVQATPGVEWVRADTFQRLRDDSSSGLESGVLEMGRLEIARLDDDPDFPERGVLRLETGGGL